MNLIRRLNRGNLYFSKLEFSNVVANWRYESYGQIQNFRSIYLKLCMLGQKHSVMDCEYRYNEAPVVNRPRNKVPN